MGPGAAKGVGGAWTSLGLDRYWSGIKVPQWARAMKMGLMWPHRAPRSSRRPLGEQEGSPPQEWGELRSMFLMCPRV